MCQAKGKGEDVIDDFGVVDKTNDVEMEEPAKTTVGKYETIKNVRENYRGVVGFLKEALVKPFDVNIGVEVVVRDFFLTVLLRALKCE